MLELSQDAKRTDVLALEKNQQTNYVWAALQCFLFSWIIAVAAQIKIPLGFTPVPLTLQPLPLLFTGMILGPTKGLCTVLFYLAEGCLGLPVFAGGASGFAYATGATGGYLLGYLAQAWLSGHLPKIYASQSSFRGTLGALCILTLAVCTQLLFGTLWLSRFVGWDLCFTLGFFPFLFVDLGKAMLGLAYLQRYKP